MSKTIRSFAKKNKREYVTPEDVTASIDSGRDITLVQQELLEIIGGFHSLGTEGTSCCAFVAARAGRMRKT